MLLLLTCVIRLYDTINYNVCRKFKAIAVKQPLNKLYVNIINNILTKPYSSIVFVLHCICIAIWAEEYKSG